LLTSNGKRGGTNQFSAEVPSRIPVTLIRRAARHYDKPRADSGVFKKAMRANGGHQRRARTAASDKPCMRDMLIARPLHAFVGRLFT
jgi:hypothetical protein